MRLDLNLDGSELLEALAELSNAPLSVLDTWPETDVVQIEGLFTPATNELLVRLQPSDGLNVLIATARTRHVQL
jgi:hypothetical protein